MIPPEEFAKIIVTIDGPAGTGKSSVARALAAKLGLEFLDTGAMYRAAAAIAIDNALAVEESDAIVSAVAGEDIHFDWTTDPPELLCCGVPMSDRIRQPDITAVVSQIAAISRLREHMVRKQRIVAEQHPRLVTEGRDQGSVVFPDANVKFYLDASPEVRARRRAAQLREAGRNVDEVELMQSLLLRDESDASRKDGPLICPADAIKLDTSDLTMDEVVETLEDAVRRQIQPELLRQP